MREFIYLDEISVYSLLASRKGAIATEFTDSETASLQSEVAGSVGVGLSGLAKADIASRLQAARTQASQVLRKAIVQTTFKELYELEQANLRMLPISSEEEPPSVSDIGVLFGAVEPALFGWVVDPISLSRGVLAEVEVELSAEPIFRFSAVISSMLEMMRESDELARMAAASGEVEQVAAVANLIERLLAGLIPIRGRAVDFEVVQTGMGQRIVHRRLTEQLGSEPGVQRQPLVIVGVAEEALFWKDIRRVLFSGSHYRVLGRIGREGLKTSWTPVKLADVLRDVAPDLASELTAATEGVLAAALDSGSAAPADVRTGRVPAEAMREYAGLLATHYGRTLSEEELESLPLPDGGYETFDERLKALRAMTAIVEETLAIEVDSAVAARLRFSYLVSLELELGTARNAASEAETPEPVPAEVPGERYLDVEFIAMYW